MLKMLNFATMLLSMTGFGKSEAENSDVRISAELKSLNSKQLDLSLRVSASLREAEVAIRQEIVSRIVRGKVDAVISCENIAGESSSQLNVQALKAYRLQIAQAAAELGVAEPADWFSVLTRLPDSVKNQTQRDNAADLKLAEKACSEAISRLLEFRATEGAKLEAFFRTKIESIRGLLRDIDPFEKERVPKIRARLEEQLARLTGVEYDKGRLEQELIFYIEKLDVNEEKLRLTAHLDYFLATLGEAPGQGKKLGFIAQEMGREINTLGSKSNHAGMQQIVVRMKDELEQIKEQVLNVL